MKALSFLGTTDYQETTYRWDEQRSHKTHLFPEAIARIFEPEKLLVLVTSQAKAHENFQTLCKQLGNLVQPVDIPEGKSEAELWKIFDLCDETVKEGDELLLDITHAFRLLPLFVFSVAAYLRCTKKVTIRHILYGAYEARDEQNRSPILDLTPLLDLLDWQSGAEMFLRRSDAETLADQLDQTHQRLWKERTSDTLPYHLKNVATKLQNLSRALHLSRPREVMCYAHELLPMLDKVMAEVQQWAKPFGGILEKVKEEAAKFAHDASDRLDAENLRKQLALIKHYLDKGLTMQAVPLAREWVVSWVALQRDEGDWLDSRYRESEVEKELGAAAARLRGEQVDNMPDWFEQLPQSQEVAKIWNWLTQLRNDVAHCGMRRGAARISVIDQRAKEIPQKLRSLMDSVPDRVLFGSRVVIDLKSLYGEVAKLDELPIYLERAKELAGEGNEVVLTGQAPVWLYLAVAHSLHGKARKLLYTSPTTGEVPIFDHSAR